MGTKHTPGLWKFSLGDTYNPSNGIVRSKDGTLITLRATMNAEDEATMRLIAAAPELLEALKAMVAIWEGPRELAALRFAKAVIDARAAIAKATGE